MKRIALLLVVLLGLFMAMPAHAARLVVGIEPGTATKERKGMAGAVGGTYEHNLSRLAAFTMVVPDGEVASAAAALERRRDVRFVERDQVVRAAWTPDDPKFGQQWALAKIQAADAWEITRGSAAATVAVVDTGVDASHPDLAGKIVAGYDYVDGDNDPADPHGHGTHVAGIVAAATNNAVGIAGAAPDSNVMAVRVLDADGTGWMSDVAAGITYAADQGAKVINLSLGSSSPDTSVQSALVYARGKGAVVTCATGNSGGSTIGYPAAYSECVAVGATTSTDARASFSQYGEGIDIMAPGASILSTVSPAGYESWSGTSMATPYVSGVAALLAAQSMSGSQIEETLKATATDLGSGGYDTTFGWGRVDAAAAVAASLGAAPAVPSQLTQYRNDGLTAIPAGSWTQDGATTSIALSFSVQDADSLATLTPWVEVVPVTRAFNGLCGRSGTGMHSGSPLTPIAADTPTPTTIAISGLSSGLSYKWRACAIDENGARGGWGSYGTPTDVDFGVDASKPLPPDTVNDGNPADIDFSNAQSSLDASWSTVLDGESGTHHYSYCVSTETTCAGTLLQSWNDAGTQTSANSTGVLAEGLSYFVCVQAHDNVGNVSDPQCSDGVTIDRTAPAAPTDVRDGSAGDAAFASPVQGLSARWIASNDAVAGVARYEQCVSTGADCSGTVVAGWSGSSLATSSSRSPGSLQHAQRYLFCARAVDGAGNTSPAACSDGVVIDAVAPAAPGSVRDGTGGDIWWTGNSRDVSASWDATSDPDSGLAGYEYCVGQHGACAQGWSAVGLSTSLGGSGRVFGDGRYTVCVRAADAVGNVSSSACSNGQLIDTTAPSTPASVRDGKAGDLRYLTSRSAMSANWPASSDAASGIRGYRYCISTGPGCSGAVVANWTDVSSTGATRTGLRLSEGRVYFTCVQAIDGVGRTSASRCSNGQKVDTAAPAPPATVRSGQSGVTFSSAAGILATWKPAKDTAGIARYEVCISTKAGCRGAVALRWTKTGTATKLRSAAAKGKLKAKPGASYRICVRAVDRAGRTSKKASCSAPRAIAVRR